MLHWSKHLPVLVYAHNSDKAVAAALPGWPRSLCLQVTGIHPPTHFLVSQCLLQAAKNIFPFHRHEHNLWHKVLGLLLSCPEPSFSCSSPFSHTLSANLRFPANLWVGKGEITAPLSQGLSSCWLERCKNLDQCMCRETERSWRTLSPPLPTSQVPVPNSGHTSLEN